LNPNLERVGRTLDEATSGCDVPPDIYDNACGGGLTGKVKQSLSHLLVEVRLSTRVTNVSGNILHHEGHPLVGHSLIGLAGP
jgi:hypothetical protein